jgi:asparagine synthase (glutamine-hydrolysing)
MCGITGVLNLTARAPTEQTTLLQMLEMIRHRGPDGFGIYRDQHVGLGNARLSIIDLSSGDQPIGNEDGTVWIVFNGEIFNYVELRSQLEARGHCFSTRTDTEVIVHLYEDYGPDCLRYLNGQFAIALWDTKQRRLFLARDRLGVRPLFFTVNEGRLIFGSEIKSILAHPGIGAEIDPAALTRVFTYWSTLSPSTIFRSISEVPPGHYLLAHNGQFGVHQYWALDFEQAENSARAPQEYLDALENLLIDATCIRLRADVPVGAYLSGGLDSSMTTAIIRKYTNTQLDTFSIAFADNPEFDESQFQQQMANFLGTSHQVVHCTHADIGRVFPDVIWHTETPILRTAPAPMFLLSKLVHENNFRVVMTGEGADEFLAGYEIFKEMRVRRFWAKNPDSQMRSLLLRRLYPDIKGLGDSNWAYLTAFFKKNLTDTGSPYYSHAIRWNNTARIQRFLLHPLPVSFEQIALPSDFHNWSHLAQAQYLEISIFLSQYLLSSQGDRVAMAHSVEGRFPFLDYRVVEFCNRLPPNLKLHGLTEKWLLKQLGRKLVPTDIWKRPKRPYRAPIHRSFFNENMPDYVHELFLEGALKESGLFDSMTVTQLVRKVISGARLGEVDDMALAGILSTQLVYRQFVKAFPKPTIPQNAHLKMIDMLSTENKSLHSDGA